MGLSRNHFQLKSGKSPVRSQRATICRRRSDGRGGYRKGGSEGETPPATQRVVVLVASGGSDWLAVVGPAVARYWSAVSPQALRRPPLTLGRSRQSKALQEAEFPVISVNPGTPRQLPFEQVDVLIIRWSQVRGIVGSAASSGWPCGAINVVTRRGAPCCSVRTTSSRVRSIPASRYSTVGP